MPRIRTIAPVALCIACGLSAARPCPAQETTPSFRVATRLVELTVVASDKNGKPVTDLTREDFSVYDRGKPRQISVYHYEGGPPPRREDVPAPHPFVFSNRTAPDGGQARNITALLLDFVNTEPRNQMFVKAQTANLLRALAPQTRFAIYLMGRNFRVIHDFTDDMESLRASLEQLSSEFQTQRVSDVEAAARQAEQILDQIEARKTHYAGPVFAATQAGDRAAIAGEINSNATVRGNRVETTLAGLEALGRHLAEIPGRKSVVWISGGISMLLPRVSTSPDGKPYNPIAGDNLEKVIRKTSERLAQLGIALYAVDARGLTSTAESLAQLEEIPPLPGRVSELERAAAQNTDSRAALSLMTSITGGRYIFGTNDLSEGVKKASLDLRSSYSLGFYAPEEPDGKWHALRVAVRRPDVNLLCKEGYLADAAPLKPQVWDAEAEQRAMMDPLGSNAIRLTAECAMPAGAEPGVLLLTLQIGTEDLLWSEKSGRMIGAAQVYIGEKSADGKVRFEEFSLKANFLPPQMEAARSKGLPFRHQWQPGADTVSIRVLVRDTVTGRMGTLDIPRPRAAGSR